MMATQMVQDTSSSPSPFFSLTRMRDRLGGLAGLALPASLWGRNGWCAGASKSVREDAAV